MKLHLPHHRWLPVSEVMALSVKRMKEGAKALCECRHNRAFKIDLPIQRHEKLDCSHFRVIGGECLSRVYIFVREVLDCVAQNFECVSGIRVDATPTIATRKRNNRCAIRICERQTSV
jgi:hypothetical protein